jgi:thiol-disulfide isomerase/thioredoxin
MSKASKFTMVDPTLGEDVYAHMAQAVNDRMGKAVDELAEKHAAGGGKPQQEASADGPTGAAYRAAEAQERARELRARAKAKASEESARAEAREAEIVKQLEAQQLLSDEEEDDDENEGDAELKRIREKRLAELKASHQEKVENLSKGHGQYREITQDEFLPEVTGSRKVLVHFYHREFMRCKIMDKHLALLAPQHPEAKFVKIDAEKAPFFVGKLQVQVLPTLVVFEEGVAQGRLQGFQGLTDGMPKGREDEFPTSKVPACLFCQSACRPASPACLPACLPACAVE